MTANNRVTWTERYARDSWEVKYTSIGASIRGENFICQDASEKQALRRLRSQAMVAVSNSQRISVTDDVLYFCAIAKKILQRGELPPIPHATSQQIASQSEIREPIKYDEVAHFMFEQPILGELDPHFQLDATFERPFWMTLCKSSPSSTRYLTPQTSLENLCGESRTSRWVDFAYYSPLEPRYKRVIEIDGAQHRTAEEVDKARDLELQKAGYFVNRVGGDETSQLIMRFVSASRSETHFRSDVNRASLLSRRVLEPTLIARFALGYLELLSRGAILPAGKLHVEESDQFKVSSTAAKSIFDFFLTIERLWNLAVLPEFLTLASCTLRKQVSSYEIVERVEDENFDRVQIFIEPLTPHHASLPSTKVPTCIIRNAFIPVDLAFLPIQKTNRRTLNPEDLEIHTRLLVDLLTDLFGFGSFRENQDSAILSSLQGADSLALLPTGSGKSLIYQMVGLLQPGLTIVVAPLVALIDDQVRRLSENGIDRVQGLHQRSIGNANQRDRLYEELSAGSPLFVLLSPERLQNQQFREAVRELAQRNPINSAVLDEAHCISEWGHDFRTSYLKVARNLRYLCSDESGNPPAVLALTGTASPSVLRDVIREIRSDQSDVTIIKPISFDRTNLNYYISIGSFENSQSRLVELVKNTIPEFLNLTPSDLLELEGNLTNSGIIFVPHVNGKLGLKETKRRAIHAFSALQIEKPTGSNFEDLVGMYSGKAPNETQNWDSQKVENARAFVQNETPILVATKAFGMGIDKPNIRWTIHLGYPSSLENFAQEAGRAGRDGAASICSILAAPAPMEFARQILDLKVSPEVRNSRINSMKAEVPNDLETHLFFHRTSFVGINQEVINAKPILDLIFASSGDSIVEIPLSLTYETTVQVPDSENRQFESVKEPQIDERRELKKLITLKNEEIEKAIFRLSLLGIVDDYTIEHGSRKITLHLGEISAKKIDEATEAFLRRLEPGALDTNRQKIVEAPQEVRARAEHHLNLLVTSLYNTIEPARIRALTEMQQLCANPIEPEDIRQRIIAYLSGGPLATVLEEIVESTQINIDDALSNLDSIPTVEAAEWIGASARQLETYPDNPIVLAARSVGENAQIRNDIELLKDTLTAAFSSMPKYGIIETEAAKVLGWIGEKFQSQIDRPIDDDLDALATAWEKSEFSLEPLLRWEQQMLFNAVKNPRWNSQLSRIRARRVKRNIRELEKTLNHLTGEKNA